MGRGGESAEVTSVTLSLSGVTPGTKQYQRNTSLANKPRFALGDSARTTGTVASSSYPLWPFQSNEQFLCLLRKS